MSASAITTPSPKSLPSSEEVPNELLVLPQPLPGRRKKQSMTKLYKEITDAAVLQELKEKEQAASDAKKMKEEKNGKRTKGKREARRKGEKEAGTRRKAKRKRKESKRKSKKAKKQRRATKRAPSPADTVGLESLFAKLDVEDNGQCSSCAVVFSQEDEDRFWVCCDRCDKWYCFACHKLPTKDSVPDEYYCT